MSDDFNRTEWITTAEAAELTGDDVAHIRYLVREGIVRSSKFGRAWMVHYESIRAYTDEMKQLGAAKHDPWRVGARKRKTEAARQGATNTLAGLAPQPAQRPGG